jgi:hypothetical protein
MKRVANEVASTVKCSEECTTRFKMASADEDQFRHAFALVLVAPITTGYDLVKRLLRDGTTSINSGF